jgi:hypothetical protein
MLQYSSTATELLSVFQCVIGGPYATYLSGPITTGRRFVDWFAINGPHASLMPSSSFDAAFRNAVVVPNETTLFEVAALIRRGATRPVIEPASLRVSGWQQASYHEFWTKAIELFAARMVVVNDWQYSVGCAIEFRHAVKLGLPIENCHAQPVSPAQGSQLIKNAANDIGQRSRGIPELVSIAKRLHECAVIKS